MKIDDRLKRAHAPFVILQQRLNLRRNILRRRCQHASYFVGQRFKDTGLKNRIRLGLLRPAFQRLVKGEQQIDGQRITGYFQHLIEQAKMVRRILDISQSCMTVDGTCLENLPRLVFGQPRALNVIGVVSQLNLGLMVDVPLKPQPLLTAILFQKRSHRGLHVELEVHDVAVLHDVVLAFLAQLARIATALFAA